MRLHGAFFMMLAATANAGPNTALAQTIPEHTHIFGAEGMGMGFGAMMIFGPLFFLVVVAFTVAIAVLAFRWFGDKHGYAGHGPLRSPLDVLKERFARGEIDKAEYEERRRTLND